MATSFIDATEEVEAKEFIKTHLGFDPPRMCGYFMAVKLFIREEDIDIGKDINGKEIKIAIPETVRANDKYKSCTALVVAQGPECYKGERFKDSEPWCKVGDWIIIPRHEGPQINYRGVPMHLIPDDKVYGVVEDPSFVTRD